MESALEVCRDKTWGKRDYFDTCITEVVEVAGPALVDGWEFGCEAQNEDIIQHHCFTYTDNLVDATAMMRLRTALLTDTRITK